MYLWMKLNQMGIPYTAKWQVFVRGGMFLQILLQFLVALRTSRSDDSSRRNDSVKTGEATKPWNDRKLQSSGNDQIKEKHRNTNSNKQWKPRKSPNNCVFCSHKCSQQVENNTTESTIGHKPPSHWNPLLQRCEARVRGQSPLGSFFLLARGSWSLGANGCSENRSTKQSWRFFGYLKLLKLTKINQPTGVSGPFKVFSYINNHAVCKTVLYLFDGPKGSLCVFGILVFLFFPCDVLIPVNKRP